MRRVPDAARERNPRGSRRLKTRRMRLFGLLALLALAAAVLPATAAAERSVPRGWLGVIADGPLTSGGAMDGEWDLMASSGAESVRTAFYWPSAQRRRARRPTSPTSTAWCCRRRAAGCPCCRS